MLTPTPPNQSLEKLTPRANLPSLSPFLHSGKQDSIVKLNS